MSVLVIVGRGDDQRLVYARHQAGAAWGGFSPLPGNLQVFSFSAVPSPGRVDVYAVGYDRHAWHWGSADAGQTWDGPTDLGGEFTSPLQALIGSA